MASAMAKAIGELCCCCVCTGLPRQVVHLLKHLVRRANHLRIRLIRSLAENHVDHFLDDAHVGVFEEALLKRPGAIGARLAAIYATNLGDVKPTSAGHWLKTLSNLGDLRVWWAETDAHEEYSDALLQALGTTPWGNRAIEGTLLSDADQTAAKSRATAAVAAATKANAAPRKAAVRKAAASRQAARVAPEKAMLSKEGLERLTAELADLKNVQRPAIIASLEQAPRGSMQQETSALTVRFTETRLEVCPVQICFPLKV